MRTNSTYRPTLVLTFYEDDCEELESAMKQAMALSEAEIERTDRDGITEQLNTRAIFSQLLTEVQRALERYK